MTFGAYLADSNAFGWVTPDVTPMSFVRKITTNLSFGGSTTSLWVDLGVSASQVLLPFIQFSDSGYSPYVVLGIQNGRWALNIKSTFTFTVTLRVYLFSVVIPQPLPASGYGMAVFNSSGACILTNETNPLRILEEITLRGVSGIDQPAQSKTYSRSIAVFPKGTGNIVLVITGPTGPPIFRPSFKSYIAVRSGSSTTVTPTGTDYAAGSPSAFYAPYIKTYVIDTSIYD